MEIIVGNIEELGEAARRVMAAVGSRRVVVFDAPMGAGKTTLISEICHALGVADDISSPTFSIVNEYVGAGGRSIYHFDCYRLERFGEALDMGAEDYLESGCLCLIEWPEILAPLLPADTARVAIEELPDASRRIIVS